MTVDWNLKLYAVGIIIVILSFSLAAAFYVKAAKCTFEPLRVACVGDSITQGSGYPIRLRLLLGSNYSVVNFGVSGSTVSLSSDKPYMSQRQFQQAQNFMPDVVVIMLGTNDARPDLQKYNNTFDEDYSQLVNSFQQLDSNPQIYVVKSPPIQNSSLELSASFFNNLLISEIEQIANDHNLPTVDVYSAFENHSNYFMDGVHPNSDGAALIASTVYNSIASSDE
jgi:lysophospholipase L1-like esterase